MSETRLRTNSPFIAFCNANRERVKSSNPNVEFGHTAHLLSDEWKQLNDNEKAVYANTQKNHGITTNSQSPNVLGLRRSSRLRNKRLGLDFFGCKL